jgi:fatty acid desaturase
MKQLRAELTAAGVFRHHEAAGWAKVGLLMTGIALCLAGTIVGPTWLAFLLIPIASVFATTVAMFGHEGSHRSFSASPRRNAVLNHITFPLLTGLSAMYWRHKHDGAHHGHPNVDNEDPDVALWPMTSSQQGHLRSGPFRRWFQRNLQGWFFWPLTLMLPTMMRVSSLAHLYRSAKKHGITGLWLADVACLVTHYTMWLVVPTLIWGFLPTFLVYMGLWTLVGGMLALIFAPAHMGLPIITDQNNDWEHQFETTRNLRLPRVLRFFFVGLDYQVEHHLFPKIPHQELPRAEAIVKAWCERVGIKHLDIGYGDAVVSVTRFLRDAWKTPTQTGAEVRGEQSMRTAA